MARHAKLPDDEHVQRRPEGTGDLVGYGHASPREGQDEHVVPPRVLAQPPRQIATGLEPVTKRRNESPHRLLLSTDSRANPSGFAQRLAFDQESEPRAD